MEKEKYIRLASVLFKRLMIIENEIDDSKFKNKLIKISIEKDIFPVGEIDNILNVTEKNIGESFGKELMEILESNIDNGLEDKISRFFKKYAEI